MKRLWNSFKIAFAMYSKIPMPQADWEKENMLYNCKIRNPLKLLDLRSYVRK